MDYHLEREPRLLTLPKSNNLYRWAINEVDAHGQKIGDDQIPWAWSLHFTATSCAFGDSIDIESKLPVEESAPALPKIAQRQVISVRLRPGSPRDDEDYENTSFSMFGTDRAIKIFQLDIYPITDPARQESCSAWGSVSYTAEIDFRHHTEDDCITFYLFVSPETFARYAEKVAHGLVDEITLRVGSVSGFYSEWSPSISTRHVKVLAGGAEQKVALPPGIQFEPPRLGHVGKAELYINRRLEFRRRVPQSEAAEGVADPGTERAVPQTQPLPAADPRMIPMLGSLRRAAWFVVSLLALILAVMLLK